MGVRTPFWRHEGYKGRASAFLHIVTTYPGPGWVLNTAVFPICRGQFTRMIRVNIIWMTNVAIQATNRLVASPTITSHGVTSAPGPFVSAVLIQPKIP